MLTYEQYQQSAAYIRQASGGFEPEILLVLGSGLGFLAEEIGEPIVIPYGQIPHFQTSTAPDHAGRFVLGTLAGRRVMAMQGRLHLYEGIHRPAGQLPRAGGQTAGGGDHGGHQCQRRHQHRLPGGGPDADHRPHPPVCHPDPLIGPNLPEFGPRFCDMTYAYTPALQQVAREEAAALGMTLREGVYFYFTGPQFETPAEIRAARVLGGDVAGMSTVPEVICASHCGMAVLGFSLVTNMAAGVTGEKLDGVDVVQTANRLGKGFSALVPGPACPGCRNDATERKGSGWIC